MTDQYLFFLANKDVSAIISTEPNKRKIMNKSSDGVYQAPTNKFGILASGILLSEQEWSRLLDGPISAVEPDYQAELAKPVNLIAQLLWEWRN
jgi:hypothetical protein